MGVLTPPIGKTSTCLTLHSKCRRCSCQGGARDSVVRPLTHEPLGWRPTTLEVTVRRYRCTDGTCGATTATKPPNLGEALAHGPTVGTEGVVCQHLSVACVAEGLGVACNTTNDAVLAEGRRVRVDDVTRFEGVAVIGADEHVRRHTRRGDEAVTSASP